MLIYWILLLVPGTLCVLLRPVDSRQRNRIVVSAFFIILLAMLMLRSESCGIDLSNYKYYFMRFSEMSWEELKYYDLEPGYKIYVKIIGAITDDFQLFLALTAVICLTPIAWLYLNDCEKPFLLILLFVNMSIFPMIFSGLRQAMAIAVGVFVYDAVRNRKLVRAMLLSWLACQFHESAVLLFLFYPFYHLRIRRSDLFWIIPAIMLCYLLRKPIFQLLGRLAEMMGSDYDATVTSTGAFMTMILFALFYVFSMIVADEQDRDPELFGLRNMMLLALLIQLFSSLHFTVTRVGYYTLVYVPMLLPKVLSKPRREFREITWVICGILCLFFFCYFMTNGYFGEDMLQIFPYVPFWGG